MAEDGDVSSELHQRFLHFLAPDDSGEYLVFYSGSCVVNLVWRALVHFVTWSVSARRAWLTGRGPWPCCWDRYFGPYSLESRGP